MGDTRNYGGGAREGAGRKTIGERRVVTLTLPPDLWAMIDDMDGSTSAAVRDVLYKHFSGGRKMTFEIGKTYAAALNEKVTTFEVVGEEGDGWYWIKWADSDEESAHYSDMERWCDAPMIF